MTYKRAMCSALFLAFRGGRLIRTAPRKILLTVGRLKAYESTEVAAWLEAHEDKIEVFYLPTHAPERNPDEYPNNDLKCSVNAQGLPHDKDELRSHIQSFMRCLLSWPAHVISYFQHPFVQSAAAT